MSAKVVNIRPRSDLCELHEVKVLRSIDPVSQEKEPVNLKQQHIRTTEDVQYNEEFLKKLELEASNITPDQRNKFADFLLRWRSIFSQRNNRSQQV